MLIKSTLQKLSNLSPCALLTTGRTGSDLLQSLLDSHPEILTFNGQLHFYEFWGNSTVLKSENPAVSDLIDEFIGAHIEKLKSKYDLFENKHRMGTSKQDSISIDLTLFKQHCLTTLKNEKLNTKNVLLSIYYAYALCLGQNMENKKIFFHHIHNMDRIDDYLADFPGSKIIMMTRDPRANITSGVLNWRADLDHDNWSHLFAYLKRIFWDAEALTRLKKEHLVIKIEELGNRNHLEALVEWLGISFNECLFKSTFGGILWHGDRLSVNKKNSDGWSASLLKNNWGTKLSTLDKYLLNFLLFNRLRDYNYESRPCTLLDFIVVPFLIPLPLRFELHFFSFSYIKKNISENSMRKILKFLADYLSYFKRVKLFYLFYYFQISGRKFSHPVLKEKKTPLMKHARLPNTDIQPTT